MVISVDVHVGSHLFHQCLRKLDCARVLVTNQLQYLPYCDQVLVVENGQIAAKGTFAELAEGNNALTRLLEETEANLKQEEAKEEEGGQEEGKSAEGMDLVEGGSTEVEGTPRQRLNSTSSQHSSLPDPPKFNRQWSDKSGRSRVLTEDTLVCFIQHPQRFGIIPFLTSPGTGNRRRHFLCIGGRSSKGIEGRGKAKGRKTYRRGETPRRQCEGLSVQVLLVRYGMGYFPSVNPSFACDCVPSGSHQLHCSLLDMSVPLLPSLV